ncbi:MAG: hypothetical protein V1679_02415 [Candidatus Peregrinibacteria bacterium]
MPEEDSFKINTDQPASTPQPQTEPEKNPLNTGDGQSHVDPPIEETPDKTPVTPAPEMEPSAPLEHTTPEPIEEADKSGKGKLYIMVTLVVIALLVIGFVLWKYFLTSPTPEPVVEESALTNTLSGGTPEEEAELVENLEETFPTAEEEPEPEATPMPVLGEPSAPEPEGGVTR